MQGDNYTLDIEVLAQRDVCEVVINAMLPDGVNLIRSSPEGLINNGRQIKWTIDGMKRGECITNRVTLRADREGDMCVCFCVTAVPVQFCTVLCARPNITCSKVGPCEVGLCDPVNYCVTVTNNGTCAAEDVVVIDQIPPELEHASGQRTLTYKLGCIEPCQTKKFNVCLTAAKLGKACNTVIVTSCNANQCTDTFCTLITQCGVDLQKSGPKEIRIGGTATYDLTVTNIGNKLLTEVVISDCAPNSTTIVDAPGSQISGNQAIWKFKELQPGEKQNLQMSVTSCTPGYYVNRAQVTTCQGCSARAEAGTRWRGTPGLNVQIANPEGPICVGDATTYFVRVVNQGTEEDQNVSVIVRFPKEIVPTQISGATAGRITNGVVTFNPANIVGPRQTLEYRIEACAREPGDARIKVEVSSDNFKTPIIQEESTIVS
jgi:conserved repeat domain/conserved repeat domain